MLARKASPPSIGRNRPGSTTSPLVVAAVSLLPALMVLGCDSKPMARSGGVLDADDRLARLEQLLQQQGPGSPACAAYAEICARAADACGTLQLSAAQQQECDAIEARCTQNLRDFCGESSLDGAVSAPDAGPGVERDASASDPDSSPTKDAAVGSGATDTATTPPPPPPPPTGDPCAGGQPPAFPTAEGFGRCARGGRGGKVIEVTSLGDSGAGTLRACVEASGPRTCVFRRGGIITLDSRLKIRNPQITIAGQTAPGGGITLRNAGSNEKTPLTIVPTTL